jgi:thioredoxin
MIREINSNNYQETLDNNKFVIVDYYADWCGPCKILAPVFEKSEEENDNEDLLFAKINVDNEEFIAKENMVMSIPTLIIYQNGAEIAREIGGLNYSQLKDFVMTNVSK